MPDRIDSQLHSKTVSFDEIPVVDIGPLIDGTDPDGVAREIGYICENVGFLYVRNHGVAADLVGAAYKMAKEFFDLPFESKDRLNVKYSGEALRGYIPLYGENVDPENTRDFKECFDMAEDRGKVSPFFGPNQMPDDLPGFAGVMERYHAAMLDLGRKLVSAIALSLDLPADYFESRQRDPITIQRLLHYPPQSGEISTGEIGIGAHTDYGFLTILSQDSQGGLQVQNRQGDWISAPPIEGTFIVNIGDLVQTFTNDRYISTMHRVVNAGGKDRYSLPFFMDMDFDAMVEVLPNCSSSDNPPRYQPYTCGEHKYRRFRDSYAHLKAA